MKFSSAAMAPPQRGVGESHEIQADGDRSAQAQVAQAKANLDALTEEKTVEIAAGMMFGSMALVPISMAVAGAVVTISLSGMLFVAGIVFFAYFYTHNVAFKVDDVAENLKSQNGFVPGIRPGKKTEEYLEYVVNRVLVLGSAYLALVCLLPEILRHQLAIPFYFGGTSVLIVVSVTMDTINQVQSHLLAHQYEGLIEKSQLRGKKRGKPAPSRR